MRFAVLIKANEDSEAGRMPEPGVLEEMGRFNEEMVKAGVMVAGEGLHPSSKGRRIVQPPNGKGKLTVVDGPFAETKELIAGFWIIQAKSLDEATEWMKRCPTSPQGHQIEIRQIFELTDFPSDVFSDEEKAKEQSLRDELDRRAKA